jgi:hypothetical protein
MFTLETLEAFRHTHKLLDVSYKNTKTYLNENDLVDDLNQCKNDGMIVVASLPRSDGTLPHFQNLFVDFI